LGSTTAKSDCPTIEAIPAYRMGEEDRGDAQIANESTQKQSFLQKVI
jgi:hypothetical protein